MIIVMSGCERREMVTLEVENFELIRTVAVDKQDGQIKLTASTGIGLEDEEGKIYSTSGASIAEALENLRRSYTRGEAFFAYTEHIIIGKDAYDCLETVMDLVARSIDMRLGINLYVVENGSAEDLVNVCQGKQTTISDMLTSVVREVSRVSRGYVYTCGDVMSSLSSRGYALITAISAAESEDKSEQAPEYDVLPVGFAVVKDGKIVGFTNEAATAGAIILNNINSMQTMSLGGVTVQVTDIKSKISSDDFKTIKVDVTADAGIIEDAGELILTDDMVRDELEKKLATKLLEQVKQGLIMSRQYNADFCGVGKSLEMCHPTKFRSIDWDVYFPDAQFDISIKANIQRTYDVSNPVELKGEEK